MSTIPLCTHIYIGLRNSCWAEISVFLMVIHDCRDQRANETSNIPLLPNRRVYRECGKCRKPEAKLKCACLATYYCDTRCQREDLPAHRQECTYMMLKEIHLIHNQLHQHKATHGKFTIEVARLELLSTETCVKLADLLCGNG